MYKKEVDDLLTPVGIPLDRFTKRTCPFWSFSFTSNSWHFASCFVRLEERLGSYPKVNLRIYRQLEDEIKRKTLLSLSPEIADGTKVARKISKKLYALHFFGRLTDRVMNPCITTVAHAACDYEGMVKPFKSRGEKLNSTSYSSYHNFQTESQLILLWILSIHS